MMGSGMCGVRLLKGSSTTMKPLGYVARSVAKSATRLIGANSSTSVTSSVRSSEFRRLYANLRGLGSTLRVVPMRWRNDAGVSESTCATLMRSLRNLTTCRMNRTNSSALRMFPGIACSASSVGRTGAAGRSSPPAPAQPADSAPPAEAAAAPAAAAAADDDDDDELAGPLAAALAAAAAAAAPAAALATASAVLGAASLRPPS